MNKRLVVAGTPSLWDIFLQEWLNAVHSKMPELALRAEDSTTLRVMEKLERGSIDIGFIYEQPKLATLVIEELKSIPLATGLYPAGAGCGPGNLQRLYPGGMGQRL